MRNTAAILGIGNILWADEGFGVRAVEALNARYCTKDDVQIIDGGTQGLSLLPIVEDAEFLLIFDAIDFGLPCGTMKTVFDEDVPRYLTAKKLSLHQTSFQDVLALAQLSGRLPPRMVLIGVQPLDLNTYGGNLTAPVAAQISPAVKLALCCLEDANVKFIPRLESDEIEPLGPLAVSELTYEFDV